MRFIFLGREGRVAFLAGLFFFAMSANLPVSGQEVSLRCDTLDGNPRAGTLFNQCKAINADIAGRTRALKTGEKSLEKANGQLAKKCIGIGRAYWQKKIGAVEANCQSSNNRQSELDQREQILRKQVTQLQSQLDGFVAQAKKLTQQKNTLQQERDKALGQANVKNTQKLAVAQELNLCRRKTVGLETRVKTLERSAPPNHRIQQLAILGDCESCPDLMRVTVGDQTKIGVPGDFMNNLVNALPQMAATLPEDFAVTKREITVGQFMSFVKAKRGGKFERDCVIRVGLEQKTILVQSPSVFAAIGVAEPPDLADHPAVCLSKSDARDYANWLSEKAGAGKKYRLLSEVEWEYSARAHLSLVPLPPVEDFTLCNLTNLADLSFLRFANQASRPHFFTLTGRDIAHCQDNRALTARVGSMGAANGFGLLDMLGNVAEMTEDCWFPGGQGKVGSTGIALLGGAHVDCKYTAVRGGSFSSRPDHVTLWFREKIKTENGAMIPYRPVGYFDVGFRLRRGL